MGDISGKCTVRRILYNVVCKVSKIHRWTRIKRCVSFSKNTTIIYEMFPVERGTINWVFLGYKSYSENSWYIILHNYNRQQGF